VDAEGRHGDGEIAACHGPFENVSVEDGEGSAGRDANAVADEDAVAEISGDAGDGPVEECRVMVSDSAVEVPGFPKVRAGVGGERERGVAGGGHAGVTAEEGVRAGGRRCQIPEPEVELRWAAVSGSESG
jgi:hypothetical protein